VILTIPSAPALRGLPGHRTGSDARVNGAAVSASSGCRYERRHLACEPSGMYGQRAEVRRLESGPTQQNNAAGGVESEPGHSRRVRRGHMDSCPGVDWQAEDSTPETRGDPMPAQHRRRMSSQGHKAGSTAGDFVTHARRARNQLGMRLRARRGSSVGRALGLTMRSEGRRFESGPRHGNPDERTTET
jgi:hypothetical protein